MAEHVSGVYAIEHIASGTLYIGSSHRVSRRFVEHKRALARNSHVSPYLQHAWNKYGSEAFRFYLLERCEPEVLIVREQEWLDVYHPEYNVCPTAGSRLGAAHTEEGLANVRAGAKRRSERTTHCPKGHEYTPENTRLTAKKQRKCKQCEYDRSLAAFKNETPEQREARLVRVRVYTQEHLKENRARAKAYGANHKAEKSDYDRQRRETLGDDLKARQAAYWSDPNKARQKKRLDHQAHRIERLASLAGYRATHKAERADYDRERRELFKRAGLPRETKISMAELRALAASHN